MRVNVYAEEMTDRIEIVTKEIDGQKFTGVRFYLELPVTTTIQTQENGAPVERSENISGPFIHHTGDDDSAAVTFWGKQKLRHILILALEKLDLHTVKI